jgi:hypothetical protein
VASRWGAESDGLEERVRPDVRLDRSDLPRRSFHLARDDTSRTGIERRPLVGRVVVVSFDQELRHRPRFDRSGVACRTVPDDEASARLVGPPTADDDPLAPSIQVDVGVDERECERLSPDECVHPLGGVARQEVDPTVTLVTDVGPEVKLWDAARPVQPDPDEFVQVDADPRRPLDGVQFEWVRESVAEQRRVDRPVNEQHVSPDQSYLREHRPCRLQGHRPLIARRAGLAIRFQNERAHNGPFLLFVAVRV